MQISYQDLVAEPTTLRIPMSHIVKTGLISLTLWSGIILATWMLLY